MAGHLAEKLTQGESEELITLKAHCSNCRAQRTFHIQWVRAADDQPSEVVDLAQWVGLYHLYADKMEKADSPAQARSMARLAAQCLAEALKFYSTEEMPPESAFGKDESIAAFRNNPANFAKTRLRELEAMLPAAGGRDSDCGESDRTPDGDSDKDSGKEAATQKAWWKIW